MRINRVRRFRAKKARFFMMGSMFFHFDEEDEKDVPKVTHSTDDNTYKAAESYGCNGRFEPVREIDAKDTVLSRSSIAVTKPDSDSLVIVFDDKVETMRHDKECMNINDYSYKLKNQVGKINKERGW